MAVEREIGGCAAVVVECSVAVGGILAGAVLVLRELGQHSPINLKLG